MRTVNLLISGLLLAVLTACGGDSTDNNVDNQPQTAYAINVVVTGINGTASLKNGTDILNVSQDGTYSLGQDKITGTNYNLEITSQPTSQTCSVMNPSGIVNDSDVDNIFVNCALLTAESIVLSANDTVANLATVSADSLTFSSLPVGLTGASAGDVIFAEQTTNAPDGLLRKIVSVQTVGGQTIIQTEPGTLAELIEDGGFSFKGKISNSLAAGSTQGVAISQGVTLSRAIRADSYCSGTPTDYVLNFTDKIITDEVSISGCVGFDVDLDLQGKFKGKETEYFRFVVGSSLVSALDATTSAASSGLPISVEYTQPLGHYWFTVPAGVVPIPVKTELALAISVSGQASAAVTAGLGISVVSDVGIEINDGTPNFIKSVTPQADIIGPYIDASGNLKAGFGPEVSLKICDVAGPQLALTAYGKLDADISRNPWWTFDAGLDTTIDIAIGMPSGLGKINGFGLLPRSIGIDYNLASFNLWNITLAQANGAFAGSNSSPTAQFSYSPTTPKAGQSVAFTNLSTDPDADTLSWYWNFGDGSSSTLKNPSHAYTSAGQYSASLEASDPDGATHTANQTLTVDVASTGGSNSAPVANAGADLNVATGSTVILDGSTSSDTEGDALTYQWGVISVPTGSNATLTNADTFNPSFTADVGGNYVFSLVVNDGSLDSTADSVTITAVENSTAITTYGNFALTANSYDASDWETGVSSELGGTYRVADWDDLVAFYNAGGDLSALMDALGFGWDSGSAALTYSGSKNFSSTRYYFIARHDHVLPTSYSFLVHTSLDNHMIDLGSWGGSRPVLAIKTSTTTTPGTVTSLTGRVWMDRNLGASQVATAYNDAAAYGDLYQWGRGTDGHEKRTSTTTTTLSSSDTPGHGSFILNSYSPYDWRSPQNDNLWQGVAGTNNPCPAGFRLPTIAEWQAEMATWSSNDQAGAFASPLKLVSAGYRNRGDGTFYQAGSVGYYWSSTVDGAGVSVMFFYGDAYAYGYSRSIGFSVRCLED